MKLKVFTQDNCAPCRKLKPKIKELDVETEFVDITDDLETAREHVITSTPTTLVMEDGEEQERLVGDKDKEEITKHF